VPGAVLEFQVARLAARARRMERALHDRAPWIGRAYEPGRGVPHVFPMTREIIEPEGRIVLSGYLECEVPVIDMITIGHAREELTARVMPTGISGPCRVMLELSAEEFETAP
jgi:hypothetical protein